MEKYNDGISASAACLGGIYAGDSWYNLDNGPDAIVDAMRATTARMQSILGDRWYGELQWNNVPQQHELNQYIIQIHQETGLELISTADSHYPNPEAFKDRELYKRLGFLNRAKKPEWLSSELPVDVEEMGMELYPKNGDQMWESYKKYSEECGATYDDDLIYDSLVKTHYIANERIEDFMPDDTVRLPSFVVPEGETADEALLKLSLIHI